MYNYPTWCKLKTSWRSHRGKLFPAGTVFKKNKEIEIIEYSNTPGCWYLFQTPIGFPYSYMRGLKGMIFVQLASFVGDQAGEMKTKSKTR